MEKGNDEFAQLLSALKEFKNKLFPMAVHLAILGTSTQKPEACKQGTGHQKY